ncbi:hypothetical protein XH93_09565 [Bradyrhizobium sp. CCBAU 51753]|nr:hypothetical protein XH93_09565 [Bradyrhizobium sp. CCBAU 51753]
MLVPLIPKIQERRTSILAIAPNFTEAAKEIAASFFKQKTGHEVLSSFGASRRFHSQITQAAPLQ